MRGVKQKCLASRYFYLYKETWDAKASLKTICAFANDIDNWGGGYLVIGVEDKDSKPTNLKGVPAEKIDS